MNSKQGWIMHSNNHFEREERGYIAHLKMGGFYPSWSIFKDGVLVDAAQYHPPVTSKCNKELAGKAQVEKYLKELP